MNKVLKLFGKYLFIFLFCGIGYVAIELLFRGRSDVSMFILAGICGTVFLTWLNNIFTYDTDFILQVFICGTMCTLAEWICGLLINTDFHVWDYRTLPLTSPDGQVNFFFYLAWCLICAIVIPILDYIEWKVFDYKKDTIPYYMVFGHKLYFGSKGIMEDRSK